MNVAREAFLQRLQAALDDGKAGDLPGELYRDAAFDADLRQLMHELEAIEQASASVPAEQVPADLADAIMRRVREAPRPASAASHRGARVIVASVLAVAAALLVAGLVGVASLFVGNEAEAPAVAQAPSLAPTPVEALPSLPRLGWEPEGLAEAARRADLAGGEARRTALGIVEAAASLRAFVPEEAKDNRDGALLRREARVGSA